MLFLYHCLCYVNQCLIPKTIYRNIIVNIVDVESYNALSIHLSSEFVEVKRLLDNLVLLEGPWARRAMTSDGHGPPETRGGIPW